MGKKVQLLEADTGLWVNDLGWDDDTSSLITFVVYSPDGRNLIVVKQDGRVGMWDTNTWKNTINFNTHHDKDLTQVTFSPDGRNIITASNDTTARIWDVTTGEKIATLYHRAPVKFAGYNPDGNHIITITGKMVIWDTQIVRGGGDFVAKEVDNNK